MRIEGVSIVVRVYNGMPHLRAAVQSALRQTYAKVEVLVIDDGSQDGTAAYLDTVKDARLRVIRQENQGPAAAGNRGLREAKYNWIAILDADDLAAPERIEKGIVFLEQHPEYACLGSRCGYVGGDDQPYVAHIFGRSFTPTTMPNMLQPPEVDLLTATIPHSSAFYDRRLALEVGGYRVDMPVAEDYDLLLRLADRQRIACLPETLAYLRILPSSLTSQHMRAMCAAHHFARTCAQARRSDRPEPAFEEFMNAFKPSAVDRRSLRASSHYRLFLAQMTSGRRLRAWYHLGRYASCAPAGFLGLIKSTFRKMRAAA